MTIKEYNNLRSTMYSAGKEYHYFCGACGHRFTSDKPERNENGLRKLSA